MLQRVESHFGREIVLPASMPMTAADDDLIEYQRSNLIPWLDKKFTLEIHVETLTGETEKLMHWTFEEGENDYTMGHVLSWAKDKYPTPQNGRHVLALCDRVLDDTSTDLETPMRTYLHRHCRDYNSNSTELQLRGALIFVNNIERSDNMFVCQLAYLHSSSSSNNGASSASSSGSSSRLKRFSGIPHGVVAVRHTPWTRISLRMPGLPIQPTLGNSVQTLFNV